MGKIVFIMGSPHKNGNNACAIEKLSEGAKQAGAQCVRFDLCSMDIRSCIGCRQCVYNHGICVQDDAMKQTISAISSSAAVVIASPVYMCQVSGTVKTFLDRLLPLTDEHHHPRFGERPLYMLYTYGAPVRGLFRQYIRCNGKSLAALGLKLRKNVILHNCGKIDSLKTNQKRIARLVSLGMQIAKECRKGLYLL